MTAFVLPLIVITGLGCGGKKLASQDAGLIGRWTPAGYDGEITTIVEDGKHARVAAVVDTDGEAFEVQSSGWIGDNFTWTYLVPSTGFVVKTVVLEVGSDELVTHWSNHEAEDDERLMRAE